MSTQNATVITNVQAARMLTLRKGLELEIKGLSRHGRSCYAIIKEEFGLKGSKQKVLDQFTKKLRDEHILNT